MIQRTITKDILSKFGKGKAILIFGPRQVGKTTLLSVLSKGIESEILLLNGDNTDVQNLFENVNTTKLKAIIGKYKYLFIDEGQRIKNIGLSVKIVTDNFKDVQVVATGSSSFELANQINEPLTGRKYEYYLYPLSYGELVSHSNFLNEHRELENRIIFGNYPEIVTEDTERINLLKSLTTSYLYKDLLNYEGIQKSSVLMKLLQALALQIGSEVSYNELAQIVGIDKETVEKYIRLLEQSFVIFKLPALSRNLRNELKKSKKIYFYDTGIRNAVLGNFNNLELRTDKAALWENFIIAERMKYLSYRQFYGQRYFWRTHNQAEIDYIEEIDGQFKAFEIKYNPKKKVKLPESFKKAYPGSSFYVINKDNYYEFLI
jgi:uncharacterized protein